jgi:hypothetical protein
MVVLFYSSKSQAVVRLKRWISATLVLAVLLLAAALVTLFLRAPCFVPLSCFAAGLLAALFCGRLAGQLDRQVQAEFSSRKDGDHTVQCALRASREEMET